MGASHSALLLQTIILESQSFLLLTRQLHGRYSSTKWANIFGTYNALGFRGLWRILCCCVLFSTCFRLHHLKMCVVYFGTLLPGTIIQTFNVWCAHLWLLWLFIGIGQAMDYPLWGLMAVTWWGVLALTSHHLLFWWTPAPEEKMLVVLITIALWYNNIHFVTFIIMTVGWWSICIKAVKLCRLCYFSDLLGSISSHFDFMWVSISQVYHYYATAWHVFIVSTSRKELKKGVLLYIHINFIIALTLALLVFVTSIETAAKIQVYILHVQLCMVICPI